MRNGGGPLSAQRGLMAHPKNVCNHSNSMVTSLYVPTCMAVRTLGLRWRISSGSAVAVVQPVAVASSGLAGTPRQRDAFGPQLGPPSRGQHCAQLHHRVEHAGFWCHPSTASTIPGRPCGPSSHIFGNWWPAVTLSSGGSLSGSGDGCGGDGCDGAGRTGANR